MGPVGPTQAHSERSFGAVLGWAPRGLSGCLLPSFVREKGKGPHSSRKAWKSAKRAFPAPFPLPSPLYVVGYGGRMALHRLQPCEITPCN